MKNVILITTLTLFTLASVQSQVKDSITSFTVEVPVEIIENVPVYAGCYGSTNANLKKCMSDKINYHVGSNFNQSIIKDLDLEPGLARIYVKFKINTEGDVVDIESRGPHPALEDEATRVVGLIPSMTPGKQRGEPVNVMYSLPIVLKVDPKVEEGKKKKRRRKNRG